MLPNSVSRWRRNWSEHGRLVSTETPQICMYNGDTFSEANQSQQHEYSWYWDDYVPELCPWDAAIETMTNNMMVRELVIRLSSLLADYGAKTKTTTKLFSRVIWKSNLHKDMQVDVPFLGRSDVLRAVPWNAGIVLDFLSNFRYVEPSFLVLTYLSGFILADLAQGPILLSAGYPGHVSMNDSFEDGRV